MTTTTGKAKSQTQTTKTTAKVKAQATGLYGQGVAIFNKAVDKQKARAEEGIVQARKFGASLLEDISKRLDTASKKVDELAKKTR